MKKAQILSAIALAFALGLAVIPSANTYASISSTSATEDQIQAVYNEIGELNDEYAKLQMDMNFNSYSALYKLIEGESDGSGATLADASTAIADKIANWEKGWLVDWFNDHMANSDNYINTLITNYNNTLATQIEALVAIKNPNAATVDSSALRLSPVTKISTISEGYTLLENLLKTAESYHKILINNYGNTAPATTLRGILSDIEDHLNDKGNGTTDDGGWLNMVDKSAKGIFTNSVVTINLPTEANYIKNINKNVYDTMVQDATWKAGVKSGATGMQMINAFGVLVKTARGLDKWSFVGPVVEGKAKTDAIANTATGAPVVDYGTAVKDTAAFKAAIAAFINGKTTTTPGANDTPGAGEDQNKPGNDLTTPPTGALLDGENSASTTVAMVAGIATALTAAGAGVVAYRNARRSSRK